MKMHRNVLENGDMVLIRNLDHTFTVVRAEREFGARMIVTERVGGYLWDYWYFYESEIERLVKHVPEVV